MNNRITNKERNLLKGAIRRVFSRSELRKRVIDASRVEYADPSRPRVKKWSICPVCTVYMPTYKMEVDHISPIIPLDSLLAAMSWDTVIDRTWCEENNLMAICQACHKEKSKQETKKRTAFRRERKLAA